MANVRPYNPSVRVGNWYEDIAQEEEILKDFLKRKENGQLLSQQKAARLGSLNDPIELSASSDGQVRFGNIVMLENPSPLARSGHKPRPSFHMNIETFGVPVEESITQTGNITASLSNEPTRRAAFVVECAHDGQREREALTYGSPFLLKHVGTGLYLGSETSHPATVSKRSRHQVMLLFKSPQHQAQWTVVHQNPQVRFEYEFQPVPSNARVLIKHLKTGRAIHLEPASCIGTLNGLESEVTVHTQLDSHLAEEPVNHWQFRMPPYCPSI